MPASSPSRLYATPNDHRECRAAIRVGSRSFFAASRLLPAHVRRPAFALYAFCRLSDAVVDLEGGSAPALARLSHRLQRAHRGQPLPNAADRALAETLRTHAIPLEIPEALLEGLAWDAQGRRTCAGSNREAAKKEREPTRIAARHSRWSLGVA